MPDKQSTSSIRYYLKCMVLSFYSKRLYIDVMRSWRGYGVGYLLCIIAIASIPFSVRSIIDFNHFFKDELLAPIQSMPLFYIQNGQVLLDKPMPYYVKNKAGEVTAIIDTTGQINDITDQYPKLMILITNQALYFKSPVSTLFFIDTSDRKITKHTLPPEMNEVFSGRAWVKNPLLTKLQLLIQCLIYPTIITIFFIFYFVLTLLLSLMGQIIAQSIFQLRISFKESNRIIRVACTPQLIVLSIALSFAISFKTIISSILMAIYFSYALLVIKKDRKHLKTTHFKEIRQ